MFVYKPTQNMHQRYIFIEKLLSVMTSDPRNIICNVEGKLGRICNIVKKLTHIVYIKCFWSFVGNPKVPQRAVFITTARKRSCSSRRYNIFVIFIFLRNM